MVHMSTAKPTKNDPNNLRLKALIAESGLTQPEALELFNTGMVKKYSLSIWKAYLGDPASMRWRRLGDDLLKHAEKMIGNRTK